MKLSNTFKLFFGIGISLFLVFIIAYSAYLSLKQIGEDNKWVNHTNEVIFVTKEIVQDVAEAEADHRGYLLRGDKEFAAHFTVSVENLYKNINLINSLVEDNPAQLKRVDELVGKLHLKIKAMHNMIAFRDNTYVGDKTVDMVALESKGLKNDIRRLSDKIFKVENELLLKRQKASEASIFKTILIIAVGVTLVFAIVIILFYNISKAFKAQNESRKEINEINVSLEESVKNNEKQNWLLTGQSLLNNNLQGDLSVAAMAENIIKVITEYTNGKVGAVYLKDQEKEDVLQLVAGYGLSIGSKTKKVYNISDGWIGQVVKNKKATVVEGELNQQLKISTGIVETYPLISLVIPFYYNNDLKGVVEVGYTDRISKSSIKFIENSATIIGVAIDTAFARETMHNLYIQTQQQAEELESQQEELRVSNEELMSKTELLQSSEEELRVQQEELRQINVELEEKAKMLENSHQLVLDAKDSLTLKMKELEQISKYKSEFLANMSHELRTPLNSILILARILKDNKLEHLSDEEVKYATVIFKAGSDLLSLINDILDLSKIESGFVELNTESVSFNEIKDDLIALFQELANNTEVNFKIDIADDLPKSFMIDKQRLEQILRNLISNAFKFTSKQGSVTVSFFKQNDNNVNIAVSDTGIGISPENQKIIFEAFKQADGSTSREYGGTGLGLSISRELSKVLGGEITLESVVDKGSTFLLSLPLDNTKTKGVKTKVDEVVAEINYPKINVEKAPAPVVPDVVFIEQRDKPLLMIVEDDEIFNDILKDYATNNGFDTIQVYNGDHVEELVLDNKPNAILLDVMLPGIDGWKVLKQLKSNERTANIPVHMMSAGDFSDKNAIKQGANSFIKKPINNEQLDKLFKGYSEINIHKTNKILLIEDHVVQSNAIKDLFNEKNIEVVQAFTGAESLQKLAQENFDCIILDLHLPDISGEELLEKIKANDNFKEIPVIINTAMELGQEKLQQILKYSNSTVLKSVKSGQRLIDEVNLFLHKIKEKEQSPEKQNAVTKYDLKNKTVLLVDDDMRNVFAISAVLDQHGLNIEIANDGIEALEKLETLTKVDVVLMDIMMPRLDGYETMKRIRAGNLKMQKLPIIALTAKAMKEDRDKCIAAGANDYITKPVDIDQLISLIKIWVS